MAILFNPIDPEFLQNPYPKYAELRRDAPVWRHPAGFVAVSSYQDVVQVLKTPEIFSSKAMGGMEMPAEQRDLNPSAGSLIGKDPPVHTRMRNIVNRGFTSRRIAEFETRTRRLVDELFADFQGKGEVDLVPALTNPMPVTVIAELLGLDPGMRDQFKHWAHTLMVGSTAATADPSERARNMETVREFSRFMRTTTEERRKNPGDDLISLLIHAEQEDGILSADEVVGFASLLLFAGAETTTNLIGNAVLALLAHPEQLEEVRADPSLIPAVLEETLRWDSPIQLVMRLVLEETELAGVVLPKNAFVFPILASANRDDAQFEHADRFDLHRNTQGHLGFGFGTHFCLGANLARLEARIALEAILMRLPNFCLTTDLPIDHLGGLLVRGPRVLPLRFDA